MTGSNSRRPNLWRNPDFNKLWTGQTVSTFDSLLTRTALPLVAILQLHASPLQMAWLGAIDLVAGLIVGLLAGVVVDRFRRRPLLIATDVARAALVLTVPSLAIAGLLRMELLYLVAFLTGLLTTVFEVAYAAYLPTLIAEDQLLDGNSKLAATASAVEIVAFGSGGWLVQAIGAPFALIVDAVTFLVSAVSLAGIAKKELPETHAASGNGHLSFSTLLREAGDGWREVLTHPELRPLALSQWLQDLGGPVFGTLFLLFVTRELGISPGVQGSIYAIGGVTALGGALLTRHITRRIGTGHSIAVGLAIVTLGMLAIPLAPPQSLVGVAFLILNQLLTDPAATLVDITRVTLRQTLVENRLQGRVSATLRAGSTAAALTGTLGAGLLGEHLGLRTTLLLGIACTALAPLVIVASPLRHYRTWEDMSQS